MSQTMTREALKDWLIPIYNYNHQTMTNDRRWFIELNQLKPPTWRWKITAKSLLGVYWVPAKGRLLNLDSILFFVLNLVSIVKGGHLLKLRTKIVEKRNWFRAILWKKSWVGQTAEVVGWVQVNGMLELSGEQPLKLVTQRPIADDDRSVEIG